MVARAASQSWPPDAVLGKTIAEAIRLFGWQGKTFDAAQGVLLNRISPFHINAIAAKVYAAPSYTRR